MHVLIAPQEFKGSLTPAAAAAAIAAGLRRGRPAWTFDLLPMSDGGPGFLDAMAASGEAEERTVNVHDPLGRAVQARYLVLPGGVAVVEAAEANGLWRVALAERDPLGSDTFGVGELLLAALSEHPVRVLIGVGGSATTDGGAGMARALGATFRDGAGRELGPGGAALLELARVDWRPLESLRGVEIVVASDVTNPLTGPNGAAAVYGPQKGAGPADVDLLDAALVTYAAVIRRSLGVDVSRLPGAGGAGGLGAGLAAFLGARIESGFEAVAAAQDLDQRLAAADVVITGEGSFDGQSLQGKTTGRLLDRCAALGRRCVVFAGVADPGAAALTLASLEPDPARAMAGAAPLLEELAARWAAGFAD